MTAEDLRPQFAKAEEWINPLLERAKKIEAIDENVVKIRDWVTTTGTKSIDTYGNTTYRKRMRRSFHNQRFTYIMNATSENDPESVDILEKALAIEVVVAEIPTNEQKQLDVSFKYDDPIDPEQLSPFEPAPELLLFCHIFAHETTTSTILETEWRRIPELMTHELNMVYELTNTVAGFVPIPTPEHTP
jgi:hypothetical protein